MKTGNQLIFGIRAVIEAITAGKEIEKCLIKNGLKGALFQELFSHIKNHNIPFQFVPIEKINSISRKNHQGVLAFLSEIEYQLIEEIVPALFETGKVPLLLVLDQVTDVRNLGSIARTAECAGVDAVIIPQRGSAMITPDAIKTSAGALYNLNICRVPNLLKTVQFLKESGISIIATNEREKVPYHDADYTMPLAIVMGSEEKGIDHSIMAQANSAVMIPLQGKTGSLNVSVATGIILFEVVRQRGEM